MTHESFHAFESLASAWDGCQRCSLADHRHEVVFYRGDMPCDVLFIGDAPSAEDDITGTPFVGPDGDMLDNPKGKDMDSIITAVDHNFSYAVVQAVGCRPEIEGQAPSTDQIAECSGRLTSLLTLLEPKVCIFLGITAKKTLKTILRQIPDCPTLKVIHPRGVLYAGSNHTLRFKETVMSITSFLREHLS
jgi:uracil-DNA glycosylase